MYTQDHFHLFAGRAPLPTRRRQIALERCEELLEGDESVVSKRSTSWQRHARDSLVEESRTAVFPNSLFPRHCWVHHTFMNISSMEDVWSSPSAPLWLLGTCGELVAVGQVAMATGHGCRRTARTGDAGSSIDGRLLGTPMEEGKRVCGSDPVPRGGAACWRRKWERLEGCGEYSVWLVFKVLSLNTTICGIAQRCVANDEPCSFAGSSFVNGIAVTY